jgi:thiol-disulfide isomerase/thioredoxin
MRKFLNEKAKQAFSIVFMALSVSFIVVLFVFKDKLNSYASKAIQAQTGSEILSSESAFVDSAYNYSKNKLKFQITFLEFGAKGCSACNRMEGVMEEIRAKYPNRVKVVFVNIVLLENQRLIKYYGIAAIPTQVLLNKEGKEYLRHTGYISTKELSLKLPLKY